MKVFYGAGLNENQYPHPAEAATGSYNFDLQKDSNYLTPRRPIDLDGTAPNASEVRGIMQLIKRDDTETTLVQAGNRVYKWDGATTWSTVLTAVTSSCKLRDCYWPLDDFLIITDLEKKQPVMKWDATSCVTHTTGLANPLYAKYAVVHLGRLWLFNITENATELPHVCVASALESSTSFDTTKRAIAATFTTGDEAFYMTTPDLKPINGVTFHQNSLIISTEVGRLYRLSGGDARDFSWEPFYTQSGAIGDEAMVNGGNDVFYMRQGGNIEALSATDRYGDVAADDLSRWIPNTVTGLTDAIAVYEQDAQRVLFFVANKILVLYKDILYAGALVDEKGESAKLSPWSVYKTGLSFAFNTSAAKYMRQPGGGQYSIWFGDSAGNVYDLNGGGNGDAGTTTIQTRRNLRFMDSPFGRKRIARGRVEYVRLGECDFSIELQFSDEYSISNAAVRLKGDSSDACYFNGDCYFSEADAYFNLGESGERFLSHAGFSHVGKADVITVGFTTDTNVRYQVNHVEFL